jgi:predicted phage tail protein
MDERLLTEIYSEKQEVPDELRQRIHAGLLKKEKHIMVRNIAFTLAAVIVVSFFVIALAVVFIGDIVSLLLTSAFSLVFAFMAVILAVAAGKYEIRNLQKGL